MKPRIFYFDTRIESHNSIKELLKEEFVVTTFSCQKKLSCAIKTREYLDLILIDNTNLDLELSKLIKGLEEIIDISKVSLCVISDDSCSRKRIDAFNLGVDDYITRPVITEELVSRLLNKSIKLRPSSDTTIKLGNLLLNIENQAVDLSGSRLSLTPIEFKLLSLLVKSPNRLHLKSAVSSFLWGEKAEKKEHSLDTHIFNLRKKIKNFNYKVIAAKGRGISLVSRL